MTFLFKSKRHPGTVMNRYGVVLNGGSIESVAGRHAIHIEAQEAGWTLEHSGNPDIGMVWMPPTAPDEGKGIE